MKFPGVYASYALILPVFGQTAAGIHIGTLIVNAATIVLIFFLGKSLSMRTAGRWLRRRTGCYRSIHIRWGLQATRRISWFSPH